jgi:hypothetical protein
MPRILLLIILFWIVYVVAKRLIATNKPDHPPSNETPHTEKIVACSRCGLHIPENESHTIDSIIYCNNPECNTQK